MLRKAFILFMVSFTAFKCKQISIQIYWSLIPSIFIFYFQKWAKSMAFHYRIWRTPQYRERWRNLCGFRYRPYQQTIRYKGQCRKSPVSDQEVFNAHRELGEPPRWAGVPWTPLQYPDYTDYQAISRGLYSRDVTYREAPWVVQLVEHIFDENGTFIRYRNKVFGCFDYNETHSDRFSLFDH